MTQPRFGKFELVELDVEEKTILLRAVGWKLDNTKLRVLIECVMPDFGRHVRSGKYSLMSADGHAGMVVLTMKSENTPRQRDLRRHADAFIRLVDAKRANLKQQYEPTSKRLSKPASNTSPVEPITVEASTPVEPVESTMAPFGAPSAEPLYTRTELLMVNAGRETTGQPPLDEFGNPLEEY